MVPLNVFAQADAPAPVLLDNMDGPKTALRLTHRAAGQDIVDHFIDRKRYRFGSGSEHIRLKCPAGSSAQLAYDVPPAPVIDELEIKAWVLGNRPGMRLAATVVLPRTKNANTGGPYELLVRGNLSDQPGNWQQLALRQLATTVARQARVARKRFGSGLDERGAFVSRIVLLAPGGPGVSEVVVDRIEVYGVVSAEVTKRQASDPQAAGQPNPQTTSPALGARSPTASDSPQPDHYPLRIIQWQGEPMEMLAQLGFDGLGMGRLPTAAESEQAIQLGLSIVCPPPTPDQLSAEALGKALSAVSIWDLGEQRSTDELDLANRWQQLLTRHDTQRKRPTLISAPLHTHEASRIADRVLVERPLLDSDLTLRDYSSWLGRRQRQVRPGTPIYTAVETQWSLTATRQATALCPTAGKQTSASHAQIIGITSAALGAKSRGFYFRSHSSLAETDRVTRRRALILELANLHLGLAEPWISKGQVLAGARATVPNLSALVLQTERSHLLVPVHWSEPVGKLRPLTIGPVSFVVPAVAESSQAYLLTSAGPQRLRRQRVTGGIRVTVDQLPHDAFLLLTDDQQAFSQVAAYLRRHAPRTARIRRDLAALRLETSFQVAQQLDSQMATANTMQQVLGQARRELQACDQGLANGKLEEANQHVAIVEQSLDQYERLLREPLHLARDYGLERLPDQLQLQAILTRAPAGTNRLLGGGFEDLPAMLQAGWRHQQLHLEGITSAVRLSPEAPHSGSYCLELEAQPIDESVLSMVVPTAPVWIRSAAVAVKGGDLIEITGLARVPAALLGSIDGLQIIDSLGGPEMALRITASPSWHHFRILRAATDDCDVTITLGLTGFGKAQVDDLAVRIVRPPSGPVEPQAVRQRDPQVR
ncbi:MAG: hypothetical protein MK171_06165 [Pirellulales bacterium]|nr:hypothetical protein [Pirellulales bacterium]